MALRKLDPLRIGVIIGPQGLKGDKGDPGVPVPPLPPIQGPPGRDGIDGLNGVTEVVTRIVVDQEALQPVKAAIDALLEDFKKLKKRKPEFLPTGSFQGNSPIQFKDEGVNLGPAGDVDALNFTGTGVTATRVGNTITVDVAAGGGGGFTAEDAQDAVGGILVDTATIDFNYNDVGNQITADTVPAGILAQLLTVDGPGSGLDADTLDGFDSSAFASAGSIPIGANPTALVGLIPINGVATTFLRSDGAPALDQGIAPTWTAQHIFSKNGAALGTAAVVLSSIQPAIVWKDTDGALDAKEWRLFANAGVWRLDGISDDELTVRTAIDVTRGAAMGIATINLGNSTDLPKHRWFTNQGILGTAPSSLFTTGLQEDPNLIVERSIKVARLTSANIGLVAYGSTGTLTAPAAVTSLDTLGEYRFGGYDGTTFTNVAARILAIAAEGWASGAVGTYLRFDNTPIGSSTIALRALLTSAGHFRLPVDNAEIQLGVGTGQGNTQTGDFRLFHDGTNSVIRNDTGELRLTLGSVEGAALTTVGGAGGVPLWRVTSSFAGNPTALMLYNPNTTDPTGVVGSFRTDTTGVGASTSVELAGFRGQFLIHDHATRDSAMQLFASKAGVFKFLTFASSGDLSNASFTISDKYSSSMLLGGM